jgi:hypothetical protein
MNRDDVIDFAFGFGIVVLLALGALLAAYMVGIDLLELI